VTRPEPTGYGHPRYAASLAEFGVPRALVRSGGWVLERDIPGTAATDAMGCYPLFVCADWAGLEADLEDRRWVCISLVTDPFGAYDERCLRRCFGDGAVPFKNHFIAELDRNPDRIVSRHHRYYAQRAIEQVAVERCDTPQSWLHEWVALYAHLVSRHHLRGIKAFSESAFAAQLAIPGLVMFRATHEGTTVGAHLWYTSGDVGYSHLAACSPLGYDLMASYALYWFALQTFTGVVRYLDLGSGAGTEERADGLTRFKQGWATGTRMSYLCRRVFDRQRYDAIVASHQAQGDGYFPAYRRGEFA
jgi:hypothetical protein